MNKEVITLIVGGVVAVGTLVYYLFFDEKEKPIPTGKGPGGSGRGPGGARSGSSASPKSSKPTFQEYPKSTDSSKPTPRPLSKRASCKSAPTKSDPLNACSSSPIHSRSPETTQSPVSPSSPIRNTCKVCDEYANAKFLPCEHLSFCREHAEDYKRLGVVNSVIPKCPECRVIIKNID